MFKELKELEKILNSKMCFINSMIQKIENSKI